MPDSQKDSQKDWFDDGLRFSCTMCGNCCTGPPGAVWISVKEAAVIATKLHMKPEAFLKQFARKLDGKWSLKELETEHGLDCIFLDRTQVPGKAVCGIYEARPSQCRTWPFWPENLKSQQSWETTRRTTPCPGMNCGPLIPSAQIRILRDQTPK